MEGPPNATAPRLLATLAFLSGMCGLAYEVLYARLLTTYLGDMFYVSASILVAFLLGIALGARVAHRFSSLLWLVEICIGLYALVLASVCDLYGSELLVWLHPLTGGRAWAVLILVVSVLMTPSLLIGFGVPLFARYLRHHTRRLESALPFDRVYALYNLGAAACVLLIEYLLLRILGIRSSLLVIAAINLLTGLLLRSRVEAPPPPESHDEAPLPRSARPAVLALFVASAISGIYQLWFLKLAGTVFGPYHENFALVVALGLVGITVGTAVARARQVSLGRWLAYGAMLFAGSMLLVFPVIHLWAWVGAPLVEVGFPAAPLKALTLALLGLLPLAILGGTVPALLGQYPVSNRTEGHLLWVSGLGNCLGYTLMVLLLYQTFGAGTLAVFLALGLVAAGALAGDRRWRTAAATLALVGLLVLGWQEHLLSLSYRSFQSAVALQQAKDEFRGYETFRRYDSMVSLVQRSDGAEVLIIDGYRSLTTGRDETHATEVVFGITPALFAPTTRKALVLGIGKGITAGATALVFDKTVAVDVNPAIIDLQPRFASENFGFERREGVTLVLDDGISYLARTDERFDVIVNTVTSPLFFASSKLYTTEFNHLVRSRLEDDGIYAFWFDSRVTPTGARIIFDTVAKSFESCVFVYLKRSYTQLLCSASPMTWRRPKDAPWPPELVAALTPHGLVPLTTALDALAFPRHALFDEPFGTSGNTFDAPALEFAMSSAALVTGGGDWSPFQLAGVDVLASPLHSAHDRDSMGTRCNYLEAMSRMPEFCRLALTEAGHHPPPLTYLELALARQRSKPSPDWVGLAGQLLSHGLLDRAWAELIAMKPEYGTTVEYLQLAAVARLRQDGDVPDELLDQLHLRNPTSSETRRVLARVAALRNRPADALKHLQLIQAQGDSRPDDVRFGQELVTRLRAQEGPR